MKDLKKIALLGSTGSIGTHTLEVIDQFSTSYKVCALSAGKNIGLLRKQINKYEPQWVCVQDRSDACALQEEFKSLSVYWGEEGLLELIDNCNADTLIMGIVGFAALKPTLKTIEKGCRLGLANKESLIVAGDMIQSRLKESTTKLIPLDSEHSALFQLLENRDISQVDSYVITASGGPLLNIPDIPLEDVTPAMAVKHPNWSMGAKISVDSALLMNKGLELIEAHKLFQIPAEKIDIWVHPQSILHGAVWLKDGSCLAQMAFPNMKAPIAYALSYPERLPHIIPRFSFEQMRTLEFFPPDLGRFPALRLARYAIESSNAHLIALNASNEVAVHAFLRGEITFAQICPLVEKALEYQDHRNPQELEEIISIDAEVRAFSQQSIGSLVYK